MRLCIATPLYPPELGGPATYARALEVGLSARYGVEVTVVKFQDVRRFPKVIRHLMYVYILFRASKGADVILVLDPVSTGLPAWCVSRLRRIPLVVKIVGDYAWEQARQRYGVRKSLDDFIHDKDVHVLVQFLRAVQSFVTKGAKRVIVPSRYLGAIIKSWGVPLSTVSVVYNAVPVGLPGTLPPSIQETARPHIVTVGRLVPWKNIGGIVDALVQLESSTGTLIIVGDGPDRNSIEKYATTRLGNRVLFTGTLSHADTQAVIADADVFVLNSTYEGLSHLLIEALELGVPIIATSAGGNTEVIEDGVTGRVIPVHDSSALADALASVFTDAAEAKRMAARGKKSASRFTQEKMLEGTYAVLASVLPETAV